MSLPPAKRRSEVWDVELDRAVHVRRFVGRCGSLSDEQQAALDTSLTDHLGL
jgi:hypothetical protein